MSMGPFKCPECGLWWAGFEHRCRPPELRIDTSPWPPNGNDLTLQTSTVRCTCPLGPRGDNYLGTCPIHDVQVTYTA